MQSLSKPPNGVNLSIIITSPPNFDMLIKLLLIILFSNFLACTLQFLGNDDIEIDDGIFRIVKQSGEFVYDLHKEIKKPTVEKISKELMQKRKVKFMAYNPNVFLGVDNFEMILDGLSGVSSGTVQVAFRRTEINDAILVVLQTSFGNNNFLKSRKRVNKITTTSTTTTNANTNGVSYIFINIQNSQVRKLKIKNFGNEAIGLICKLLRKFTRLTDLNLNSDEELTNRFLDNLYNCINRTKGKMNLTLSSQALAEEDILPFVFNLNRLLAVDWTTKHDVTVIGAKIGCKKRK